MARLRAPEAADHDAPPAEWLARRVWLRRMAAVELPDLPVGRPSPLLFNVRPLGPALEDARDHWNLLSPEARARVWDHDARSAGRPRPWGSGTEWCDRHDQHVALCAKTCPTVVAIQRYETDRCTPTTKEHP